MNFDILNRSGLRKKTEQELLLGISRITIHNYLAGKSKPHKLVAGRVARTLAALEKWFDQGKLPLPDALSPEQRLEAVKKMRAAIDRKLVD